MHNYVFSGIYATYIEQLIVQKQKLGYKYTSAKELLVRFDRFTIEQEESKAGITKQLSDAWCERKGIESDKYRQGRIRVLAQLASFMNDLGIPSYIPEQSRIPEQAFVPYIYSRREIESMFKACDEFRADRRLMNSYIIMIPVLFRLLYGTGLRINEALSILEEDLNLESNYLVVRDSKNNRERLIPISSSLSTVCREYVKYRNMLPVSRDNSYFFISLNGNKCKSGVVYGWFRKIIASAGIPYAGSHQGPRIHDLRHTFAVHSLAKMAESGLDLYCALPYLSTYLGHQSIRATNGYVRLTAEMYPSLIKNINTVCLDIFPNIMHHETN